MEEYKGDLAMDILYNETVREREEALKRFDNPDLLLLRANLSNVPFWLAVLLSLHITAT